MKGFVYQLVCPIKDVPIYVGSTTKSLQERLWSHIGFSKYSNAKIHAYMKALPTKPIISLLEEVEYEDIHELRVKEREWIFKLKEAGGELLNGPPPRLQKNNQANNNITIRFSEENKHLLKELQDLAREEGISVNALCLRILREYVANLELSGKL